MRHGRVVRAALLLLALAAAPTPALSVPADAGSPAASARAPRPGPFDVAVESGRRTTGRGDRIAYDLYVPRAAAALPAPPWPAVVLAHGFARSKGRHSVTARYLAARGVVVLVANLVSLLGGEGARVANVANTRDHVAWLKARTATGGDALFGLVAACRLLCGGTSAGARAAYRRLFALFVAHALEAPPVEEAPESWGEALRRGLADGSLAVERIAPGP